ncbi:MAG: GGDEF domain-containing protein [Acidimicrobiales bacterium]
MNRGDAAGQDPPPAQPVVPAALAALVGRAPFGCLLVDGDLIRSANPEAADAIGVARERLVGRRLSDLIMPELVPTWTDLAERTGPVSATARVRLAGSLTPLELATKAGENELLVVAVRNLETEHYYSALARGDLTHDQTTSMPARHHLLWLIDQRFRSPSRTPLALIALWVDGLPELVASRGASAVDRVIREVSHRLTVRLRSPDLLGRLNEAGFLGLLASDAPVDQLTEIAARLRSEVAFPVDVDDTLVSFTASVAVASIGDRRPPIDRVMDALDAVARQAAIAGGDRTEVLSL